MLRDRAFSDPQWQRYKFFAVLLVVISTTMLFGVGRLSFDDDYKHLFRADTNSYDELERFLQIFPADELEMVIVFETDDVLSHAILSALQSIVNRIESLPQIASVFSIFSIPANSSSIRSIHPIIPEDLQESRDFESIVDEIKAQPLINQRLLSDRHQVTIAIAGLEPVANSQQTIQSLIADIHEIVADFSNGIKLEAHVAGNSAVRVALRSQSIHDQIVFNSIGGLLACIITYLLFRSPHVTLVVSVGPLIGVLWTLGCMGFANVQINVINQMISPLIMVIGFTDATHLMFSIQRHRKQNKLPLQASLDAIREVGFACALTSATTAVGFGALTLTDSLVIKELGEFAAIGTLLTFVAVTGFVPLAAATISNKRIMSTGHIDGAIVRSPLFQLVVGYITHRPAAAVVAGLCLTMVTLYSAYFLTTDFRFRENLPHDHEVTKAMVLADENLGGVQPINVVVGWPAGQELASDKTTHVIKEVQTALSNRVGLHNALSILDLLMLLPGRSTELSERIPRLIYFPDKLVSRFLNEEKRKALIVLRLPDDGASAQLPLLESIDSLLGEFRRNYPDYRFNMTGITVAASRGSTEMIKDMTVSLSSAIAVIFLTLTLALRSIKLGIVSFLPNILPLSAVAAFLVWSNQPLQYATIMVFTICLGIIVDDTIHLLVRFRSEYKKDGCTEDALQRALAAVGPVLLSTTLILISGFGAMMTSSTEVVVRMGYLSCLALIVALLADLILLPSMIALTYRYSTILKAVSREEA